MTTQHLGHSVFSASLDPIGDGIRDNFYVGIFGQCVGRTLMTAFARQLRGRMEVGANDQGGVTVRLIFPTPAVGDTPSQIAAANAKLKRNPEAA